MIAISWILTLLNAASFGANGVLYLEHGVNGGTALGNAVIAVFLAVLTNNFYRNET